MNLKIVLDLFHDRLDAVYGKEEVKSFFSLLIEHYLGLRRMDLILNPETEVNQEQEQHLLNALEALKNQKPIQYIIGETEFYGLTFKVNEHTLIPRPETEELVDWILQHHLEQSEVSLRILDVGTGTGCIPITLAKHLSKAKVFALDKSEDALQVAKQNAELNQVEIEYIHDDILNPCHVQRLGTTHKFDIIVSNPPYVREMEKSKMKPNVLDYEPHMALFVHDDNPLQFYEAICKHAIHNLVSNGALFFEINENLGHDMIQLMKDFGFEDIVLKQDVFGKDRMIMGTKSFV